MIWPTCAESVWPNEFFWPHDPPLPKGISEIGRHLDPIQGKQGGVEHPQTSTFDG